MPYSAARPRNFAPHPYSDHVRRVSRLLLAAVVFLAACGGAGANQVRFLDADHWQASLRLPYDAAAGTIWLDESSTTPLTSLQNELQTALEPLGVSATWALQPQSVVLALEGAGGAAQVGRLIYGELSGLVKPFSPGTSLTLSGAVEAGERLSFSLESSLTSGYSWQVASSIGLRLLAAGDFETTAPQAGAPLRQTLVFEASAAGDARVTLVYRRPWEYPPAPGHAIALQAPRLNQLADLTYPERESDAAAGAGEPSSDRVQPLNLSSAEQGGPAAAEDKPAAQTVLLSLPPSYDWGSLGKLPPVRNQGSCGSCWAFATVGVLESAIMIQDGATQIDLSEQFLVSCNQERWGCSGGATAHDYHQWKTGSDNVLAGAVYEAQFPYQGVDAGCQVISEHPYRIDSWASVPGGSPVNVEAIKQAIYTHGPVKASICAGPAFQAYRSGLFATDEAQICGGWTNHAIILTGWDDTQGPNGAWILRNSWGAGWGSGGYMLIDRRVSNVGVNASYVIYHGSGIQAATTPRVYIPIVDSGQ